MVRHGRVYFNISCYLQNTFCWKCFLLACCSQMQRLQGKQNRQCLNIMSIYSDRPVIFAVCTLHDPPKSFSYYSTMYLLQDPIKLHQAVSSHRTTVISSLFFCKNTMNYVGKISLVQIGLNLVGRTCLCASKQQTQLQHSIPFFGLSCALKYSQ